MIPSSPFCMHGSRKSSMKCISEPNCKILALTTTKWNTGKSSSIVHKYVGPVKNKQLYSQCILHVFDWNNKTIIAVHIYQVLFALRQLSSGKYSLWQVTFPLDRMSSLAAVMYQQLRKTADLLRVKRVACQRMSWPCNLSEIFCK